MVPVMKEVLDICRESGDHIQERLVLFFLYTESVWLFVRLCIGDAWQPY